MILVLFFTIVTLYFQGQGKGNMTIVIIIISEGILTMISQIVVRGKKVKF